MKCSGRRKCQHCKGFYCQIGAIGIVSTNAQNVPVADRVERKVSAVGCENQKTKTTSAARKVASASKSGENAIPGTGAKITLHPKNRYKISIRPKWLRMSKLKDGSARRDSSTERT
jgi:hypothetical protein